MKYVKGKNNGGADGLSRLSLQVDDKINEPNDKYINFLIEEKLPVDYKQIVKETRTDIVLSKVYMYSKNGWPDQVADELKPFMYRANEISIENNVLMWGYRVLIPRKLRDTILDELHCTHMGANKMKSIARQYFLWPKLDSDIEQYSKNCDVCNVNSESYLNLIGNELPILLEHVDTNTKYRMWLQQDGAPDFYLGGYLKDTVYRERPTTANDMRMRI
ncbi:hypothetical protein TSAR_016499 [Trichomalopsis sarcophagae]|uniref:RNA-directed DNA polymerase n=1 Tax=Trichomalopsis sarcophagae TaxID=543379 RepID=A0A232EP59_9HYME|nr:hypothetical protein TSAR_016499 [Trichomalopsis sarcophagae]